MSDHDHLDPRLDRAFASLSADLAHSPGPGAAAAISTARRHRRTRVGAVALVAVAALGGGLTVPGLIPHEDGVADDGRAARLDVEAMRRATEGWIDGWTPWVLTPEDPARGGALGCFVNRIPADAQPDPTARWDEPQPVSAGSTDFVASTGSHAFVQLARYADASQATAAQEQVYPPADTCADTTFIDVDGTSVRHDSMPADAGVQGEWQTDVWSVQVGEQRGEVRVQTEAGAADDEVADRVAEALVAGLRDGWTASGTDPVPPTLPQKPNLPPVRNGQLDTALSGWRAASRASASTVPHVPCVSQQVSEGADTASSSGTPRGVTWQIGGFDDTTTGQTNVERMLEEVRSCQDVDMTVTTVAHGVRLVTYDSGDRAGHGAMWLLAVGDRAMVAAVEGAAGPMPAGVADDVASVMDGWLHVPWEE